MARDHSPKERQRQQLERKLARRASYDRLQHRLRQKVSVAHRHLRIVVAKALTLAGIEFVTRDDGAIGVILKAQKQDTQ